MSVLQLFVTKMELDQILHDFSVRHELSGCLYVTEGYEKYDPMENPSEFMRRQDVHKVYLFPRSQVLPVPISEETIKIIRPRYIGWIDIWPGCVINKPEHRILIMATIQAEDTKGLPFKPATWLRRYKKSLSSFITFGVEGVYMVDGTKWFYNDIGYSLEALRLHQEGVQWKQLETGTLEFLPVNQGTFDSTVEQAEK